MVMSQRQARSPGALGLFSKKRLKTNIYDILIAAKETAMKALKRLLPALVLLPALTFAQGVRE